MSTLNTINDSCDEVYYEDEPCVSPIKELKETFLSSRTSIEKKRVRKVSFNDMELVVLFDESEPPIMVAEDLNNYKKNIGMDLKVFPCNVAPILKKGF